ncbi:MAG: glycosyltransferase family 2 protein [Cyanobacteriota bacterium]|jgi:glycosyltransferase involved in cell wall biosynthesis
MLPFVSIVICSRNRLKALKRYALPSLETMDYPSFEVVVIDDASTDGTHQFLQDYRLDHPYINVVRNEQAKGLCNARNVGVANCRGDIIAFIDDDCAVSTTWIHELVNAYTRDSIAVVGGISYKGDSNDIYINDRHVWGCNMSFRASIFQQFRFDTGLKYSHYADETDLIGRIISHGYERVVAPKAVAKHYVEDAAYRKQIPLSAYLNYHYLNAKKETWWGYYKYVLTHSLKHVAIVEYGLNFKGQRRAPLSTILLIMRKMIYYPYVLLLEIPISAKIKHAQEERLFRLNAGHTSLPR